MGVEVRRATRAEVSPNAHVAAAVSARISGVSNKFSISGRKFLLKAMDNRKQKGPEDTVPSGPSLHLKNITPNK